MKHLRLVVLGVIIGVGISSFFKLATANPTGCKVPYRNDVTIRAGYNTINAEIAKTSGQQDKGLGGRKCIGADQGMLFAFEKPDYYQFWMKDMKFAIDIVWISENKTVNDVSANISPKSYPKTFTSKSKSKYVLELQANRAQKLNITEGTNLQFDL